MARDSTPPKLLSGGNPQIPKGDGDAPVQAYLDAIPGWKQAVARKVDAIVARACPDAARAVRWNSPFYGSHDGSWFLSFHCYAKYLKLTFFEGTSLDPMPPVASKMAGPRYLHLHEDEPIDEAQLTDWIKQAAALPGWKP